MGYSLLKKFPFLFIIIFSFVLLPSCDPASSATSALTVPAVGSHFQGGIVFEVSSDSTSGKIAALADNSAGIAWDTSGSPLQTNATSTSDGLTNTASIVSTLGAGTNYAAGLCNAYEIDSAGNSPCQVGNECYQNWYLPAIDELNTMWELRNTIGGFNESTGGYWSSSEALADHTLATSMTFTVSGGQGNTAKSILLFLRCIREVQ